jgi:hypothetical protein
MTFCYARQIYASTDVSDIVKRDEDFSGMSCRDLPTPKCIRRFRVDNRAVVHRCLVAALQFLIEQRNLAEGLKAIASEKVADEANRRILMAGYLDRAELDGELVQDPPVERSYLFANQTVHGH